MSDYSVVLGSTGWSDKDSLSSTDPDKIVKGSEFQQEFNAIANAVATKFDSGKAVDINSGAIDGTTIGATTASAGTFTNLTASGTVSFPDNSISGDDIDGGTISDFASTGIDDNATSTAITIDSSQEVGIGVTAPQAPFHARKSTAVSAALEVGRFETFLTGPANGQQILKILEDNRSGGGLTPYSRFESVFIDSFGSTVDAGFEFGGNSAGSYMVISSSGDVSIGASTAGSSKFLVQGEGTTNLLRTLTAQDGNGADLFFVRDDGLIRTGAAASSPYNLTSASAANLHVDSNGTLYRSTSSARYKENIRNYDQTASIDALRPVFFNSKNEDDSKTYAGLIAEEVHDAGFTEFVEYNDAGEPDAVFYANMVALCIKEIQDLKARVAALENA